MKEKYPHFKGVMIEFLKHIYDNQFHIGELDISFFLFMVIGIV